MVMLLDEGCLWMVVHVECVCEWEIVFGDEGMLRSEVALYIRFVIVDVSGKWLVVSGGRGYIS